MSLKDSMIRGLALSGMDAIARAGYADSKMFADISNKNRASLQAKMEYDRRRDRHLREQGVTEIVHVFYEDLLRPINLETKLLKAGVPKIR